MIRKPSGDWGRESPVVGAVREAAATGKSAVAAGGRMARGGYLCFLGLMFMFGAVTSGLTGSVPGLVGGGVVGWLLFRAGRRALRPREEKPRSAWSPLAALDGLKDALQPPPEPAPEPPPPRPRPAPAPPAPRRIETQPFPDPQPLPAMAGALFDPPPPNRTFGRRGA